MGVFKDRRDAGVVLAGLLVHYRGSRDVVVLALPRGGVPVGYEVAKALDAPLDVLVVRKLGVPAHPELAAGAIASGGVVVVNDDVLRSERISADTLERIAEREGRELRRREEAYRGDRSMHEVAGKTVIVVDDGLATGATMNAAIEALEAMGPARLVVAVPAAPKSSCRALKRRVDEVVCATTPSRFSSVGEAYSNFDQTTDEQVRHLLSESVTSAADAGSRDDGQSKTMGDAVVECRGDTIPDEALFDLVGDARLVLIGEASHGTDEFYTQRANMTKRLIEERGFTAVAVEADWPDAYRVNRYVMGTGVDDNAERALAGFQRFPTWMWRNTAVAAFVDWLRRRNHDIGEVQRCVGFYGLDLYSMHRSAAEVINYLEGVDRDAADSARQRYSCFDQHLDERRYARAAAFGAGRSCEDQVVEQLIELQRRAARQLADEGCADPDEQFYAEQNARLVVDAEEYYRTMFGNRVSSWNLRDEHMFTTLQALRDHLDNRHAEPAKIVVWAHNSHLGDARATELANIGELNLGQLVRQTYPNQTCSIGFTTHSGTVIAADDWGGPARRMRVNPALAGSVEELFHHTGIRHFLLRTDVLPAANPLQSALLERAIGVIYRPRSERQSHYFRARLADQFDAVVHVDQTTALQPLESRVERGDDEPPQTYPHAV
jgi:erythromycin esterase-like protein/predicted phosphoribosyltransferase